jgi:hypothetical protein
MSQKTKLAFIASIVLNVLLVGVLLGQSPRRFERGAMREQRMDRRSKTCPKHHRNAFETDFSNFAPPPSRYSTKCARSR